MDPSSPTRLDRFDLVGCALIVLVAVLILVAFAPAFDPDRIHIAPHLNDQAGYITTARWLADEGELRSHLIYPAYLDNPDFRLYMPGHYWALAASYKLFGDGGIPWRLPNMFAYVFTAVGVYLMGRRLFDRRTGYLAAAFFVFFPPSILYAYTAMAEPTFFASCVAAFLIFLFTPERYRFAVTPFALVVPFLFRETGALLVIPMAWMAMSGAAVGRRAAGGIASFGSVLVLWLVKKWQESTGKEPTPLSWVTEGGFNYDVYSTAPPPSPSIGEWISGMAGNFVRTSGMWIERWGRLHKTIEPILTTVILVFAVAALVYGIKRWRTDRFTLGVGVMGVTSFLLVLFLYDMFGYRGLRISLFSVPFTFVAGAALLKPMFGGEAASRTRRLVPFLAVLPVLVLFSNWGTKRISVEMSGGVTERATEELENLDIDKSRLMVSTAAVGLDYVMQNYPMRWSFVPGDEHTLRALSEHYDIGTLILPIDDVGEKFSKRLLVELGFQNTDVAIAIGPRKRVEYSDTWRPHVVLTRP